MATITVLDGWAVEVVKGQEIEEKNGQTLAIETWTLVFREKDPQRNKIEFTIRKEARDELVKGFTGGVVLA